MADEPPAAGGGRIVGPTPSIGCEIGRAGAAADPRARPEDNGLHGRGWHPGVEDCAATANKLPAAGSCGARRIIGPTAATGRTIGRAGTAAMLPARQEDVILCGPRGREDHGGTNCPPRRSTGGGVPQAPPRN